MLLVGLDLETNGTDLVNGEITEIGAVLWDTCAQMPLEIFSQMIWHEAQPPLSPDIEFLTGLTTDMLRTHGVPPQIALGELEAFVTQHEVEAIVAHNGTEFDRPFLESFSRRFGVPLTAKHWIDTMMDVPYPAHITTRKLTHLAAEHGFLNPFAHRAVFDVLTDLHVLSHYDAAMVLASSKEPNVKIVAETTVPWKDGGQSTGEAKARGFRWNGDTKQWVKTVKANRVQTEIEGAPFKVHVVG
jgi:DNA polymerase-3 subunit epsilon